MPRVSVIMSVYNEERYVKSAIKSILNQSYSDFEFIIIDDGSTDGTNLIIDSFDDSRIIKINNPRNLGLTISLNKAIQLANGELIARMDGDDISLKQRLKTQVQFLDSHPDIGLVGCSYSSIGPDSEILKEYYPPTESAFLKWLLIFDNPICHPTVMFRKLFWKQVGGYSEDKPYSQDYDLWCRLTKYTEFSNIPVILHKFRRHRDSVTKTHRLLQIKVSSLNSSTYISNILREAVPCGLIKKFRFFPHNLSPRESCRVSKMILKLFFIFKKRNISSQMIKKIRQDAARRLVLLATSQEFHLCHLLIFIKSINLAPIKAMKVLGSRIKMALNEHDKLIERVEKLR